MRRTSWLFSTCLYRQQAWRPLPLRLRSEQLRSQSINTTVHGNVTPTLLTRAKSVASEHAALVDTQTESFSPSAARRIGALSRTVDALKHYEQAQNGYSELQGLLQDSEADKELRALAEEELAPALTTLSSASQDLVASLVPEHPFAQLPCLLEIRPGAGGGEASLFAADLFRMYTTYLTNKGSRYCILKMEDADGMVDGGSSAAGPISEAVIEVLDAGSYGNLRTEAGVHRVQRVPATESKGRTHTSSAAVVVLPSFPDESSDDEFGEEGSIDAKDVRVDIMKARGAGGQHVNTTNSAVRLTHIPTGTVVAIQDQRSQHKNKEKAWRLLRSKVAQQRREEKESEMLALRRGVVAAGKIGRENKIRTYNWNQQRVTDHRSGITVHGLDDVIEGGDGLDKVMESVRGWQRDEDVMALAAEEESKDNVTSRKP